MTEMEWESLGGQFEDKPDTSTEAVERFIKSSNKWLCPCPECGDYREASSLLRALAAERDDMVDWCDLMVDEFKRIKACPESDSEIISLCARAIKRAQQSVPVIAQRDAALKRAEEQATRIVEMEWALAEISKGEGAFSRDPLEHASNCIEEMKRIARQALRRGEK